MNEISFGKRQIKYELERKEVKNINLRIRSDCSVYVSANQNIELETIGTFLISKSAYILAALDKYAELAKYTIEEHSYLTGECYRYLGRELRLKVEQGRNSVITDGVYLYLTTQDTANAILKENLITKWYDAQCRELFPKLIEDMFPIFRKYNVSLPKLILRDMTSRWGSCQAKRGTITLNKRLIETPRECIEYVIVHELTHFLQSDHSRKFYDLINAFMPDWKERKATLEKYMYR